MRIPLRCCLMGTTNPRQPMTLSQCLCNEHMAHFPFRKIAKEKTVCWDVIFTVNIRSPNALACAKYSNKMSYLTNHHEPAQPVLLFVSYLPWQPLPAQGIRFCVVFTKAFSDNVVCLNIHNIKQNNISFRSLHPQCSSHVDAEPDVVWYRGESRYLIRYQPRINRALNWKQLMHTEH